MFSEEDEQNLTKEEKEKRKNDPSRGTAKEASRELRKKKAMMARFLHYYTRYAAHEESGKLERSMRGSVCKRLEPVVKAAQEMTPSEQAMLGEVDRARNFEDLSFVHVAFCELVECREFLKNSYVLGYYRYARARKRQAGKKRSRIARALENEKKIFEEMQADLEMITETLSDIVARQHMRASKSQVIAATNAAMEKRSEINVRQIGVLAEVRSEMEVSMMEKMVNASILPNSDQHISGHLFRSSQAKLIAERGKIDRSAAGPSGNTLPEGRVAYDDGSTSFDADNDSNSPISSLGSDDLGAMMSAILEVASGGNPEILSRNTRHSRGNGERTRTSGTRNNPNNLSEQEMLERAIQQSLAEERARELSRPSPPSSPPNELADFDDENEEFEEDATTAAVGAAAEAAAEAGAEALKGDKKYCLG